VLHGLLVMQTASHSPELLQNRLDHTALLVRERRLRRHGVADVVALIDRRP